MKQYRNGIEDTLGNLIGDKGLKTDVTVKVAPSTYPLIGAVVMVAIIAGILIAGFISNAIKK